MKLITRGDGDLLFLERAYRRCTMTGCRFFCSWKLKGESKQELIFQFLKEYVLIKSYKWIKLFQFNSYSYCPERYNRVESWIFFLLQQLLRGEHFTILRWIATIAKVFMRFFSTTDILWSVLSERIGQQIQWFCIECTHALIYEIPC